MSKKRSFRYKTKGPQSDWSFNSESISDGDRHQHNEMEELINTFVVQNMEAMRNAGFDIATIRFTINFTGQ